MDEQKAKPLTIQAFKDGQAPEGARRIALLPSCERELFEGDTGIHISFFKDADTGEPLWLHATLTLDKHIGTITPAKESAADVHLYLLPAIKAEQRS